MTAMPMPNVLLITADQWRADCLSALGHPTVKTPNLDALARDGVLFRNHYAQATPCGPSRASLLTGMFLMNHRAVRNGTPLDARFTNIALEMRKLGYDPALIGYTDTAMDPRGRHPSDPSLATDASTLPGFTQLVPGSEGARAWIGDLRDKGYKVGSTRDEVCMPVAGYAGAEKRGPTYPPPVYRAADSDTAFCADHAIRFIKHHNQPWFLHLSWLRPHPPFIAPEPYNRMYDAARVPPFRAEQSPEAASRLHPYAAYMRKNFLNREGLSPELCREEPEAMRQLRATYYGMMTEVDDHIGRIVGLLKDLKSYDNTLIVFTSDHGEMLWDHWVLGKEFFFEQAFHIPLIVRAPGAALDATRGRAVDSFSGSIDVMPTILDLLGAEPPVQCDGFSLRPLLQGETPPWWRREIFWELDFRDVESGRAERDLGIKLDECALAVARDGRYKYVHFAALPPLFFDLAEDPDELKDRAGDPAYAKPMLALAQRMLSWRLTKAERTLTGTRLTKNGPFECPRDRRLPTGV